MWSERPWATQLLSNLEDNNLGKLGENGKLGDNGNSVIISFLLLLGVIDKDIQLINFCKL